MTKEDAILAYYKYGTLEDASEKTGIRSHDIRKYVNVKQIREDRRKFLKMYSEGNSVEECKEKLKFSNELVDHILKMDSQRIEYIDRIESGQTLQQIADDRGFTRQAVEETLKNWGVHPSTVRQRVIIQKAPEVGELYGKYEDTKVVAEKLGISNTDVIRLLKLFNNQKYLRRKQTQGYRVFGKKYTSIRKVADEYGINANTLYSRVQKGMSLEEAVTTKVLKVKGKNEGYNVYGRHFQTVNMIADHYGIGRVTLHNRVLYNKNIEEVLESLLDKQDIQQYTRKIS